MNVDPRGVARDRCNIPGCSCRAYTTSSRGIMCDKCGHPPAKHESGAAWSLGRGTPGGTILPSAPVTPAQAPLQTCPYPSCNEIPFFDLNTGEYSICCQRHMFATRLVFQLPLTTDPGYIGDGMSCFIAPSLGPNPGLRSSQSITPQMVPQPVLPQSGTNISFYNNSMVSNTFQS